MDKRFLTFGGLGVALALLVSINVISSAAKVSSRFDLTEDKLFTLSDGAKNILGNLQEDVTLRLYYSGELGSLVAAYSAREGSEQLITRARARAGGEGDNISLVIIKLVDAPEKPKKPGR